MPGINHGKSEMPVARKIRWITACYALCFFILLAFGPGAGPALAEMPAQFDLSGKNVLVMHFGEANVPVFLKTDKGLSTTLESGGISDQNQFFESLNLRLNPGIEYRKALVEKLRLQYPDGNQGSFFRLGLNGKFPLDQPDPFANA